jgi:hypothetical protein
LGEKVENTRYYVVDEIYVQAIGALFPIFGIILAFFSEKYCLTLELIFKGINPFVKTIGLFN